MLEDSKLIPN